ncbi:hypothetical protein Nepgr_023146 [Nepenthes gracilis]|uniref:Uncharacterized protein n=1 Tax=Nepenthes gracilis TaxID=150966 RepID=A0AAD3T2C5_NEPGR|nr:hypothetical protein Nepgr_023146 [Nepenthes gracilis]
MALVLHPCAPSHPNAHSSALSSLSNVVPLPPSSRPSSPLFRQSPSLSRVHERWGPSESAPYSPSSQPIHLSDFDFPSILASRSIAPKARRSSASGASSALALDILFASPLPPSFQSSFANEIVQVVLPESVEDAGVSQGELDGLTHPPVHLIAEIPSKSGSACSGNPDFNGPSGASNVIPSLPESISPGSERRSSDGLLAHRQSDCLKEMHAMPSQSTGGAVSNIASASSHSDDPTSGPPGIDLKAIPTSNTFKVLQEANMIDPSESLDQISIAQLNGDDLDPPLSLFFFGNFSIIQLPTQKQQQQDTKSKISHSSSILEEACTSSSALSTASFSIIQLPTQKQQQQDTKSKISHSSSIFEEDCTSSSALSTARWSRNPIQLLKAEPQLHPNLSDGGPRWHADEKAWDTESEPTTPSSGSTMDKAGTNSRPDSLGSIVSAESIAEQNGRLTSKDSNSKPSSNGYTTLATRQPAAAWLEQHLRSYSAHPMKQRTMTEQHGILLSHPLFNNKARKLHNPAARKNYNRISRSISNHCSSQSKTAHQSRILPAIGCITIRGTLDMQPLL